MKRRLASLAVMGLLSCRPAAAPNGSRSATPQTSPAEGQAAAIQGPSFVTSIHATNVQVRAPAPPEKDKNGDLGRFEFSFELEDRSKVNCVVSGAQVPAAQSLQRRLSEALGSTKVSHWVTSGPEVEQDSPLFFLTAKLTTPPTGKVSAGAVRTPPELEVNGSSSVVGSHVVQCTRRGRAGPLFERAARELVACFRGRAGATPSELEIIALRFDALPVGYSVVTTETLADGRMRIRTRTAQWLPRSRTELLVADELKEEVTQNGQIIESDEAHFDDQGAGLEVSLRATGDRTYSVRGLIDGKPLEGTLQAPQGLPSEQGLQARLQVLLESHQGFDIESPSYLPALDPLTLVPIRYFQTDSKESRRYGSQLGAVVGAHELDERGQQLRQSIAIGSSSLIAERVHYVDHPSTKSAPKPSSPSPGSAYVCLE